jgi:hypothetical protein
MSCLQYYPSTQKSVWNGLGIEVKYNKNKYMNMLNIGYALGTVLHALTCTSSFRPHNSL